MQKFMKTILSGVQTWTKGKIKESITASTADWNQNDSNANNYVKNRTHWEEKKLTCIIPEMTVTISNDCGYETLEDPFPVLIVGQTYTVVLNGVTYECIARRYNDSAALLGNGTIYGDGDIGNGEPFSIASYDDSNIYLNVKTAGEYTISISVDNTVVHKLDSKYLDIPTNIATIDDVQDAVDVAETAQTTANENAAKLLTLENSVAEVANQKLMLKTSNFKTVYSIKNVVYGNGVYVAVTRPSYMVYEVNHIVYSEDGINWTEATMPNSGWGWSSVTYGNGKFVAVSWSSKNNISAYSEDGINWTEATMPNSAHWSSVTYGNGKFVAVSYANERNVNDHKAAYSEDGINWELTNLNVLNDWKFVVYGNGIFVAMAAHDPDTFVYSEDGIVWQMVSVNNTCSHTNIQSLTYGNGVFVACRDDNSSMGQKDGVIVRSIDGINWQEISIPVACNCTGLTYGSGKFILTGHNGTINSPVHIFYSEDGIVWEQLPDIYLKSFTDISFLNGTIRIYSYDEPGDESLIAYSNDGINWHDTYTTLDQNNEDKTNEIRKLIIDGVDHIKTPEAAAVGQTIAVKAVDADGKPTEWEAVDPWVIPSSTEGSTKKFKLTVDDNGTLTVTEVV